MVLRMDALFAVDREAARQGATGAERPALRQEHAQPWLQEILAAARRVVTETLPKSKLGEALTHTLNQWE